MTKTITDAGWCRLHMVIDWSTKNLQSLDVSLTSTFSDWIRAMDCALS